MGANKAKPKLDQMFRTIALTTGLDAGKDFESRIKNPDSVQKKIDNHGKGYSAKDINDYYGGRFVADTPEQKKDVIQALRKLDEDNQIKILKQEQVTHQTYHAYHVDFEANGVKGEIQVHDPHSLFESVANHEIRNQYGENPPDPLKTIKKSNAQVAYQLPADQAQNIAQATEIMRQMGR